MPTPVEHVKGNADYGTTNVRKAHLAYWQQYLGVEHRCVVPVTSFAEPSPEKNDKDPETGVQRNYWFALNEDRPLFFFAGVWTPWHGVRKVKDGPGYHEVYGFLTTPPDALIKPIHEKAMPVILRTQEDRDLADRALGGSQAIAAHGTRRSPCDWEEAGDANQVSSAGTGTGIIA
jgi:putative SOS response-associated peptidase YedK